MREDLLAEFYDILETFRIEQHGYKYLINPIPNQFMMPGVYFFFENGITRIGSDQLRVARVGITGNNNRLDYHRGNNYNGGGNHRGSVFRKHTGGSIIQRDGFAAAYPNWYTNEQVEVELPIEQLVSEYIRSLPYLFKPILDSDIRDLIESRSIELLSNRNQAQQIDAPHQDWLGFNCPNVNIQQSHLWNDNFTGNYEPNNEARYAQLLATLNLF